MPIYSSEVPSPGRHSIQYHPCHLTNPTNRILLMAKKLQQCFCFTRQNRHWLVEYGKCQKAMSILLHEAKAWLELFCLQPLIFHWRKNSFSAAFASWGNIQNYDFTWADQVRSDWWFSKILQIRTESDSILPDQDWTQTEKFHSPLIFCANVITRFEIKRETFWYPKVSQNLRWLCSSAACNHGRLTLIFLTPFHVAYN